MARRGILLLCLLIVTSASQYLSGQAGHIPPGLADKFLQGSTVGLNLKYMPISSFTLLRSVEPFTNKFPYITGGVGAAELVLCLSRTTTAHYITVSASLPAYLSSKGMAGDNQLIDQLNSFYGQYRLQYHLLVPSFDSRRVSVFLGGATAMQYESRNLDFISGRRDFLWDASVGIGPVVAADIFITRGIVLRPEAMLIFGIPWSSFGRMERKYMNNPLEESGYAPFSYTLKAGIQCAYSPGGKWEAVSGYRYSTITGYGNKEASFSMTNPYLYKYDLIQEIYLGFHYMIPSRWTKRKPRYSCPD